MNSVNKKLAVTKSSEIDIDDLLLAIFVCLPLYSIQRFITINQQWRRLLTSPTFRKQWRKRNLKRSPGLIIRTKSPTSTNFLPFYPSRQMTPLSTKLKLKQSCNGLILCTMNNKYQVCNPTTDTYHTLPELGAGVIVPGSTRVRTMSLAFDPDRYGPHYKVICVVGFTCGNAVKQVYVYSSENRVWNLVSGSAMVHVNDKGVYWNGCIHWMLELSYFDIQNGTFNNIPEPPTYGAHWRKNYYLGESCDRLTFTKLWKNKEGFSRRVDVFELNRDYSEWVVKYRVELGGLSLASVLSVVHGVEEEDSFLVLKTNNEGIMRYNLVSETWVELLSSWAGGFIDTGFQHIMSHIGV